MDLRDLDPASRQALEKVLGYLNFSSGAPDPVFLAYLNRLFEVTAAGCPGDGPLAKRVGAVLTSGLAALRETSAAFRDADQADAVLRLTIDEALPQYCQFHRDLLFDHCESTLSRPFFVGRVFEAVLKQGGPWDENDRIVTGAVRLLNDYVGYRPVPALESRKIEPYPHEFVRPVPLFVRGAGASFGPERPVIETAIKLLEATDPDILRRASFNPALMDELAYDPRAYDFDHPVNKRPNYHFGQWDPRHLDNQSRYRRFVVQHVTLDALMQRLTDDLDLPREELIFEAAAVLAGTILMASGISGEGPSTFDSNSSLAKLLPPIARYRDEFYEKLFSQTTGAHAERLRNEAKERRQPFGGARQHLNAQLARRRASQLEHVHLAGVFARMGFLDAARRQVNVVPCASARMRSEIECLLITGKRLGQAGKLNEAVDLIPVVVDLLRRGIECGAFVDPWNILGFDAQFSLFPSLDNSVHDHRVDELLDLMDQIFAFEARLWSDAAALDRPDLSKKVARQFKELAHWWHRFATHEVTSVESVDATAVHRAAERVAEALQVWHQGGAATGDVAFWAPHAEMFDSPKAYALVIDALLLHGDYVASMGLLVHWLSQAETIPLQRADSSFHELAVRWVVELTSQDEGKPAEAARHWDLARKFLDYLEANAESYGAVPQFEIRGAKSSAAEAMTNGGEDDDERDDDDILGAAYENMVFRDSTDDGVQGAIFESDDTTHDELLRESKRVAERIDFLQTTAELWKQLAIAAGPGRGLAPDEGKRLSHLERWTSAAREHQAGLMELLAQVKAFNVPTPAGDHDSLIEYDRRRLTKESLLDRIVTAVVSTAEASLLLDASAAALGEEPPGSEKIVDEHALTTAVCGALFRNDVKRFRKLWKELRATFAQKPLLYVPLTKGGDPKLIVTVRIRQHAIQNLLAWLPRRGLWVEACELLETAREMERNHPVGAGAVTEYDELFKIGYKALVSSLVAAAEAWPVSNSHNDEAALVAFLEQLTESLLAGWLSHSRTLRLSVLEKMHDASGWKRATTFISKYGGELFTQRFLNLANIRAILHQGVETWLAAHEEMEIDDAPRQLLADLEAGQIERDEAVEQLTVILESIVENYGEYRDYNSTTTQSDKGEMLYTLLDFLRLRTRYDRVCWNLKPVVLAHEILVRRDHQDAARLWHSALNDRISDEADSYLRKLGELQKKHAMRMPTVADRLAERFTRPLAIDRIRALVAPAMEEAEQDGPAPQFEVLEEEAESLTKDPTGVGLDVPAWLAALEEEVDMVTRPLHERQRDERIASVVPQIKLKVREVQRQLDKWTERQKP